MELEEALELINNPEVEENIDKLIVQRLLLHMSQVTKLTGDYYGVFHWVLQHGQYFVNEQQDRQLGPKNQCYHNSQTLSIRSWKDEDPLYYAEGFVDADGRMVRHGWNIMEDGEVIDTTLRLENCEYFGFVFKRKFIVQHSQLAGIGYPIIFDKSAGYPLLTDPTLHVPATKDPWNWLWSPENL